jgi:hypothetical protein
MLTSFKCRGTEESQLPVSAAITVYSTVLGLVLCHIIRLGIRPHDGPNRGHLKSVAEGIW